jgi:superfamily I DNA/RNA helicase
VADAASSSNSPFAFLPYAGPRFERAIRQLRDSRLKRQAFKTIKRLCQDDRSPGLNSEVLRSLGDALESRSARVTQGQGAPRLIFARDDVRIVALWVDYHDAAYDWERRNHARIPEYAKAAAPLRLEGTPPPVPRTEPDAEIHVPDPDLLGGLEAASYEEYFAALDDDQRAYVYSEGVSFLTAGAGTGKTSIAIRRALHLATQPDLGGGRVLYLCYNRALMLTVRRAISALGTPEMAREVEVNTVHGWADAYLQKREPGFSVEASVDIDGSWLRSAIPQEVPRLSEEERQALAGLSARDVLENEIKHVLSPNQFDTIEPYLNLTRPESQGLTRLRRPQRQAMWALHQRIRGRSDAKGTWDDLIECARAALAADAGPPRYRAVIVDEGQDCSPAMARLARRLAANDERRLLVLADPAQELYPGTFLWARREFRPRGGRARVLRRPYRSTRQIHALAASLYAGVEETRREIDEMTESEREGPLPRLARFATEREGLKVVVNWIRAELAQGRPAGQIAVLTGSNRQRDEASATLDRAGVPVTTVDRTAPPDSVSVSLATVNAAKGLDFTSVYLLDPGLKFGSPNSRRARFYVAITRSSRYLCIVCCRDADSPLLDDLDPACYVRIGGEAT